MKTLLSIALCFALVPLYSVSGQAADDTITVVVTGDVGFSRNNTPVDSRGVQKYGRRQPFADATAAIARDIDGDLNFCNLETVVTDRNDLPRDMKGQGRPYSFRTHPAAVRQLARVGFNMMSLANNHSMDYGVPGLKQTLKHMSAFSGKITANGIGMNREKAASPDVVRVKGAKVAFASIGIVTNNLARHRAGANTPGQIAYRFDDDYNYITSRLAKTQADYRMLSIHYGIERQVRVDSRQLRQYRGLAARSRKIDLVIGHHAHVVRAVETVGNSVIFYGLGNFLHHGTADMRRNSLCRDYGLMGKVYLKKGKGGRLITRAIEVIPVTMMHIRTQRYARVSDAIERVQVLNYLARDLDDAANGARGTRFTPTSSGTGLYCFPGAAKDGGTIGKLCKGWRPAKPMSDALFKKIAASCGPGGKASTSSASTGSTPAPATLRVKPRRKKALKLDR